MSSSDQDVSVCRSGTVAEISAAPSFGQFVADVPTVLPLAPKPGELAGTFPHPESFEPAGAFKPLARSHW
jgi:hypothetical protein